jgi:hypothetical protein
MTTLCRLLRSQTGQEGFYDDRRSLMKELETLVGVRVRATCDARNTQSIRVMEKLGMTREALLRSDRFFRGELTDEAICGLLRSEWMRDPRGSAEPNG